jgi:chaperone modulatory protein CbpM
MITTAEFLVHTRLKPEVVETWVESGWLLPRHDQNFRFSEIDVARAQLIQDLTHDMGINDEGIAVILDLVDQIHGLRRSLRGLAAAVAAQPEALRREIIAELRRSASDAGMSEDRDENPAA